MVVVLGFFFTCHVITNDDIIDIKNHETLQMNCLTYIVAPHDRLNPLIVYVNRRQLVYFVMNADPANNLTFSERSKNIPSSFYGRFVKTFKKRPFVEGF